jgi:hypothetical protein
VLSEGTNDTGTASPGSTTGSPRISPRTQPVQVFTIAYGKQPSNGDVTNVERDLDDQFSGLVSIATEPEARRDDACDPTAIRDVLSDVIANV